MSFATIARTIWDADMRRLNPSEQHVLLYLHTCPSSASEGLFPIAPGLIALDTGLKVAEVLGTLQRLEEAGYLTYDTHAEMVLLRKSLEYQPLNKKGDKRISGAVSRVRGLKPNAQLMTDFYNIAQTTSPVLAEALRDELPHMFSKSRQIPKSDYAARLNLNVAYTHKNGMQLSGNFCSS